MTGRGQEHQRRVTMNPWGLLPSPEGQGLNVLQERKCVPDPTVQSLSHVQLCDPMDCSMPGLPVHHQLPEFTQPHVH